MASNDQSSDGSTNSRIPEKTSVSTGVEPIRHGSVAGAPGVIADPADPEAPSRDVSSFKQRMSDIFTIFCSGFALISDGYQNNLMTMSNRMIVA